MLVVPTLGKPCGISDYSISLAGALRERQVEVELVRAIEPAAAFVLTRSGPGGAGQPGPPEQVGLPGLSGLSGQWIVHFQYQYSLYDLPALRPHLKRLRAAGVPVVATVHEFNEAFQDCNRFLLQEFDGLIVHSALMRDLLCRTCPVTPGCPPVTVIPMGCGMEYGIAASEDAPGEVAPGGATPTGAASYGAVSCEGASREGAPFDSAPLEGEPYEGIQRKALELNSGDIAIGFFGFMLPHKGILDLVEAARRLKERHQSRHQDLHHGLHCFIFAPQAPYPSSGLYRQEVVSEIRRAGVESYIHLNGDYLPQHKVITYLSAMDVIVLPYRDRGDLGVSSAVRTAMLASRPVIVTDTPFFHDLGQEVFKIPAGAPQAIVEAVERIISDGELSSRLVAAIERYVKQNSWPAVALRHRKFYDHIIVTARPATGKPFQA